MQETLFVHSFLIHTNKRGAAPGPSRPGPGQNWSILGWAWAPLCPALPGNNLYFTYLKVHGSAEQGGLIMNLRTPSVHSEHRRS